MFSVMALVHEMKMMVVGGDEEDRGLRESEVEVLGDAIGAIIVLVAQSGRWAGRAYLCRPPPPRLDVGAGGGRPRPAPSVCPR